MKLKSYIFQIALGAAGVGFLGSCEDMLEPSSTYVIYDDGSHLTTPADTATSLIGIIYKLQAIADRTNLLGEVRGDLVTLNTQASADLRALANFEVSDDNKYNNPRDYYAVINNCNYFIAYADTLAYDSRGDQIFAKELAQVRAIRAWTYLQLALNYGKVPFYTEPLLTEQDAEEVSLDVKDRKDIEGICDYFINDLAPYSLTEWPALHTVGSIFMANCYFPVDMVLGDLYLWKASCMGREAGKAYYREAAKCYFRWIMDTRSYGDGYRKSSYVVSPMYRAYWSEGTSSFGDVYVASSVYNGLFGASGGAKNSENVTIIPMDSASSQGYFSEVRYLYNTEFDDNLNPVTSSTFSIGPSARVQEISREQNYYYVDGQNIHKPIEIEDNASNKLLMGDLRLNFVWNSRTFNTTVGGNASKFTAQQISKLDLRNIVVYRQTDAWLRLAEALNNGGLPRMAHAILSIGLDEDVVNDSVLAYCDDNDRAFVSTLATNENHFAGFKCRRGRVYTTEDAYNTMGIHSRGCGYAELDPDYAYPMVDSLDADGNRVDGYTGQTPKEWASLNLMEEEARVDSMIMSELALETCFEGKRFYDLMRFAKRYGKKEWVADAVSRREGTNLRDGALYSKLMDERNWFLNWKGKIGM